MHLISLAAVTLNAPNARLSLHNARTIATLGGAALAGITLVSLPRRHEANIHQLKQRRPLTPTKHRPTLTLNWLAVDALSGAVGEVVSLLLLYPLDTLKVRCQAAGNGTVQVLNDVFSTGFKRSNIRHLYAGAGSAALCSAIIGAAHLLVFYAVKRAGTNANEIDTIRNIKNNKNNSSTTSSSSSSSSKDVTTSSSTSMNGNSTPIIASLAGLAASLAGSLLEVPVENWRVRAQAGTLKQPMLKDMMGALSSRGLGALYWSYGAFLLKSIPHDVAELLTYSQLNERFMNNNNDSNGTCSSSSGNDGSNRMDAFLLSTGFKDAAFGATAGVAAALASMPCDVIKTRMDLTGAGGGGPAAALQAFFRTGRAIVAAGGGGPQALFVGLVPRLLQTVPSAIVYWCVVEASRRHLGQYVPASTTKDR